MLNNKKILTPQEFEDQRSKGKQDLPYWVNKFAIEYAKHIRQKTADEIQAQLNAKGVAWHNTITNECTDNFTCCTSAGSPAIRIPQSGKCKPRKVGFTHAAECFCAACLTEKLRQEFK